MKLFSLIFHDFKLLIRDKKTFLILILMPTILVLILGTVFSGMFAMNVETFDVAFLNLDRSTANSLGTVLQEKAFESSQVKKIINLKDVKNEEEGRALVASGKVAAFVLIPSEFTSLYTNGAKTEIVLVGDKRKSTQINIVRSILDGFNDKLRTAETSINELVSSAKVYNIPQDKTVALINKITESTSDDADVVNIVKETSKNKKPVSAMQYYSIAMIVMYALFTGQSLIQSMIEEKKNRTFFRIQVSPVTRLEYISSKLLGIILVMMLQMAILILITFLLFGLYWGNLLSIALVTFAYAFAVGAIILLLGFLSDDDTMIGNLSMPVIFVFSFFGGSFVPQQFLPEFVKQIQGFIPNGQALRAYMNIAQGNGFIQLLNSLFVLGGIGVVFLIASMILSGKKGWKNGSAV